jgi:hypothetical protein
MIFLNEQGGQGLITHESNTNILKQFARNEMLTLDVSTFSAFSAT